MRKALVLLLILLSSAILWGQERHALVIGNANYVGVPTLRNPINDANDMQTALRSLGFTSVEIIRDGTRDQMERAVIELRRKLTASRNSHGFFYFAGHGVQFDGENYLIPVNADTILNAQHLPTRAVPLQWVLSTLEDARNETISLKSNYKQNKATLFNVIKLR